MKQITKNWYLAMLSHNKELNLRIIFGIIMIFVFGIPILLGGAVFTTLLFFIAIFVTAEYVSIKNLGIRKKPSPFILIYIFLIFLSLFLLRNSSFGLQKFVLLTFVIIIFDTSAYIAGKSFGHHKLCPDISPGKTIEGLLGGIFTVMLFSIPMYIVLGAKVSFVTFMIFSAILAIISQIGDIIESAFKRRHGVKDSSTFIPGHGGFLDRFDGYILSVPFFILSDSIVHLF